MSRIGKQPVKVPGNVKVTVAERKVTMAGPKGTLSLVHSPLVRVAWEESEKALRVAIDPADALNAQARADWGSTRANLANMVEGVVKGYEKTMEIVGVGWTATLAGRQLKLVVGYANPIMMPIPDGVTVTVDKAIVRIAGADKRAVGQFASDMRDARKPEPYQGKGIKYQNETIRRKQGKQFGTAAGGAA